MEQQTQEPEKRAEAQQESSGGFLTTALCVIVILGFVGWIVWLAAGGEKMFNKEPKRLTVAQVKKTMDEAEKSDPELKAMLVPKKLKANTPSSKVDVNTATAEQLAKVPGLNEWDVNAIIKKRPFASLDELSSKKTLGDARYNDVKDFLIAIPPL